MKKILLTTLLSLTALTSVLHAKIAVINGDNITDNRGDAAVAIYNCAFTKNQDCKTQLAPPIDATCGGVLVASQWVLTAAHCVDTINNKQHNAKYPFVTPDKVTIGTGPEAGNKKSADGIFKVDKIAATPATIKAALSIVNDDPNADPMNGNDFVLLHLGKSVDTTKHPAIVLPDQSINKQALEGQSAYELGFRLYDAGTPGVTYSGTLLQGKQLFLSDDAFVSQLEKVLNEMGRSGDIKMYTDAYDKNKSLLLGFKPDDISKPVKCQRPANGDSGGPLVYKNKNGKWVDIGIVSHGVAEQGSTANPCAAAFAYVNLTNTDVLAFINQTIKPTA